MGDELQFETASYGGGDAAAIAGLACSTCKRPMQGEYWQWLGRAICAECKGGVRALAEYAGASSTFLRAALLGFLTALGSGVAYAVFVGVTHVRFALVVIGIAYLVAKVIRKATRNVSGRRYQVLAVLFTYMAGAMGYAPDLWSAASGHGGISVVALFGFTLIVPFLTISQSPIGVLIIGFGLWEAWRLGRPLPTDVAGPFKVAPAAAPP